MSPMTYPKSKPKWPLTLPNASLSVSAVRRLCIPAYLLARGSIGNTGAMFAMLVVMLPAFLLAMYEKDGLPFEKVVKNIIRARYLRPGVRPYQTQNIYAPFTGRGGVRKEDAIAESKTEKETGRKG